MNENFAEIPQPHQIFCNVPKLDKNALIRNNYEPAETSNCKHVTLQFQNFHSIVADIFEPFEFLISIDLSFNAIHQLPRNLFAKNYRLKSLNLDANKFTELNSNIFGNLYLLEELSLSSNLITKISSPYLKLKNLRILNLSGNLIDMVDLYSFAGLPQLECLRLSSNKIYLLTSSAFLSNSNLKSLFLDHNSLSFLNDLTFMSLVKLQILNLERNLIRQFTSKLFSCNSNLISLALNHNFVTKFEPKVLASNTTLVHLTICGAVKIDFRVFEHLRLLETLEMYISSSECFSTKNDFKADSLMKLERLRNLKIIVRFIDIFKDNFFKLPKYLESFHLECLVIDPENNGCLNLIKHLEQCPNLKKFVLLNINNLQVLKWNLKNIASNRDQFPLEHLALCGLIMSSKRRIIDSRYQNLKHLDLTNARLSFQIDDMFRNLKKLEILNLEGIPIGEIHRDIFRNNKLLKRLNLKNCQIESIEDKSFQDLTQLEYLNLQMNIIESICRKTFLGLKLSRTEILIEGYNLTKFF